MNFNKKVSVVIPVYNEEIDLKKCLESLASQTLKNSEIIIVDDGSNDNTLEIARKFKNVKILMQNHQGPGTARNFGAKEARGDILVFIDADMTFDKSYLKNLVSPIFRNKNIIGTTHELEIASNTFNKWSYLWGKARVSKETAKEVKIFRAIRKNKFLELGGFDAKYGYADDQTLWFRHKIKPVVAENTICYHKNPDSLKRVYRQARWIGASWKERFAVFRYPAVNCAAAALMLIILPFAVLLKSVQRKRKEKKAGFMDIFKFNFFKFYGYFTGVARAVFLKKYHA